ncbi:methionine--tRNA ligase [Candidatus Gottesmanbacteria bacterium RBG_16_43_7]|uniref:Methionine--tRNA ligase n=1 Tax=Candidatus Gottesmanbacteria bacterium RBG_16_43_7 TaxID=1798373 RepID=A0A1F5Z9B8_9BACT|nr:MAG: methionine--tRNA ligase [Candidatus Gottesmanbacteria bacterium RBG_16_43_7]
MKKNTFFLTSAIPYVNARPHVGHAQEMIYADVIRRHQLLLGKKVLYLCGADENALKILQAAEQAHLAPGKFTDIHNREFLDLAKKLNIHIDVWQRATDTEKHYPASQKLWQLCMRRGDIYKKSYTGLYCIGCEDFYTPDELDQNGECLEHPGRKLETVAEENYFFRLSKYQTFLEDLITNDRLKIFPDFRKNEAMGFIRKGLVDFSISRNRSRTRGWGVPVPNDPDQVMYVWFDALNIYQSGIGFGWDETQYLKWWPQDVMVIGKGIIRFHAIYWPAILKSAGLALPKNLFIHGYLTANGQKMSKTLGNVIDPADLIRKYGTDPLRYYVLKEIPSFSDGDFSDRRFTEVYNADLANGLGNLVSRVAQMAEQINITVTTQSDSYAFAACAKTQAQFLNAIESFRFHDAVSFIWDLIKQSDKYINDQQPWKLTGAEKNTVISKLISNIQQIAVLLDPFLPSTAEKIMLQFTSTPIRADKPLFPRNV